MSVLKYVARPTCRVGRIAVRACCMCMPPQSSPRSRSRLVLTRLPAALPPPPPTHAFRLLTLQDLPLLMADAEAEATPPTSPTPTTPTPTTTLRTAITYFLELLPRAEDELSGPPGPVASAPRGPDLAATGGSAPAGAAALTVTVPVLYEEALQGVSLGLLDLMHRLAGAEAAAAAEAGGTAAGVGADATGSGSGSSTLVDWRDASAVNFVLAAMLAPHMLGFRVADGRWSCGGSWRCGHCLRVEAGGLRGEWRWSWWPHGGANRLSP